MKSVNYQHIQAYQEAYDLSRAIIGNSGLGKKDSLSKFKDKFKDAHLKKDITKFN